MSSFKILGRNGANTSFYANTDTALIPGTISCETDNIILDSNVQISAGNILSTTSTGNINLPNNASSKVQIEGVSVGATVTAANLNTLTNGGNADSLHTHSSGANTRSGLTLWATPVLGEVGYMTATNKTLAKAIATGINTAHMYGVYQGTAGTVSISGVVQMFFDTSLDPHAGDRVYISTNIAGRVSNVEPAISGNVSTVIGILEDNTGYNAGTGAVLPVLIKSYTPIIIS